MDFGRTSFGHRIAPHWTSISHRMDADSHNSAKKPFHQAVQEFDGMSKLFRQLVPFKDGIAELRRKKASYATIAELLKGEGVVVSYRTVARFHQKFVAVELRSKPTKRKITSLPPADDMQSRGTGPNGSVQSLLQERREQNLGPWTPRKRGPRIADAKNL